MGPIIENSRGAWMKEFNQKRYGNPAMQDDRPLAMRETKTKKKKRRGRRKRVKNLEPVQYMTGPEFEFDEYTA